MGVRWRQAQHGLCAQGLAADETTVGGRVCSTTEQIHGKSSGADYEGVTGLWAVAWRRGEGEERACGWSVGTPLLYNSLLVVSFTNGCRALTVGGELCDVTDEIGLDAQTGAILVATVRDEVLVQVRSVRLGFRVSGFGFQGQGLGFGIQDWRG